ncbi:metallophosphoesterase [Owenweeksia hongkongensis]|uniref:metallophosphoesterase n=1 Tax=Owenweeksia hongkongensis TaxID=253245 RepID=UPI003A944567
MNSITLFIRIAIFLAVLVLIDLYAYQAFKTTFRASSFFRMAYWIFSGAVMIGVVYAFLTFSRDTPPQTSFSFLMALMILSIVPKLIILTVMLSEDIWRVGEGTLKLFAKEKPDEFLPDRRKFVSQTALVLSAIPFIGIIHGVLIGRYRYRVINKTLTFDDLPEEFDGLTITQISDVHSGSFDNPEKIQYGIDLINEQQSDLILFTGDLVNNRAEEMEPWIDVFSQLKAPMGKYSILGNHDYGDYVNWSSGAAKQENMEKLYQVHERIGFGLLRNENVQLKKGNSTIDLVGVENWGNGFVQHGDLKKAVSGLAHDSFKILMSHDPSHFDYEVKNFAQKVHLTLSGHTHGMQFGIEIPGFIKWSPVKYRYPKWAGLYEDLGRYLYVNRGFGFLAFPGRVGIWPEITVLTLKKG